MADVNQMITELYNKIILKTDRPESKTQRVSLRQFFIFSYVKENKFRDLTPFQMTRGTLDEVINLAAQITFKLLTSKQKEDISKAYGTMTDEQLEHLKNL